MADFFEQLGKKISDVAEDFGKKTEDTLEVQRIKSQIRSLDRANERDYIEIGKKIQSRRSGGLRVHCPVRINRKERGRSSTVPGGDTQDSGGIADVIDGSRRTSRCAGVRGHGH